ncbi:MAG: DNA mismatch repair protein MutS, partial [Planctomycetota bacterium]
MAGASDPRSTPMMQQYLATKAEHPDALLLMRMGDFFECFFEDAIEAAKLLGITLTARNKGATDEVPMAGVPHHSLQGHLTRLLTAGRKVAVMDQLEDPADAKGLVRRGLTRILTPGTLIDEEALDAGAANWLVACTGLDGLVGIAALDVSTGRFTVEEADGRAQIALSLARLQAAEIVLPEGLALTADCHERLQALCGGQVPPVGSLPGYAWHQDEALRVLCERLHVSRLEGFGIADSEPHLAIAAACACRYASQNAFDQLGHIRSLQRLHRGEHLVIDATCRRNLELLRNSRDGSRQGSLLQAVDRCRSAPGSRLLADWLTRPLARVTPIRARQEAVAFLVGEDALRADLRHELDSVYDLERLLARVATGRCNARDLVQLAGTMQAAVACCALLGPHEPPPLLAGIPPRCRPAPELIARIDATLVEQPPLTIGEGGLLRDGVDAELDQLRAIKRDAGSWLAQYQAVEAERTGIPKIKVGYNKVFGYYLEVSKAHGTKVPEHFVRKQTLVNAERYSTPELKEY